MDQLLQDLRYAARTMLRAPGFTLAVVLSLGLGIGASTAIFTVLDAALLRPLPVAEPARLVQLQLDRVTGVTPSYSYPHYTALRDRATSFSGVLGHAERPVSLQAAAATERIDGAAVSGNFFDVLGIAPSAGRFFAADESVAGSPVNVVVISHRLAQRLDAGARAIGTTIQLNGRPFTVIGVAPASFRGLVRGVAHDYWMPMPAFAALRQATWLDDSQASWLNVYARLRPGVSAVAAEAELAALAPSLHAAGVLGEQYRNLVVPGGRGLGWQVEALRAPFTVMMAAVLLVMLIACANVANLLLARLAARRGELAVRLALGGSRARIGRQLLTETAAFALLAGAVGVLLAVWLAEALARWPTPMGAANLDVALDVRALGFALLATALTFALFGVAPALGVRRADVANAVRGATAPSAGVARPGTRGFGSRVLAARVFGPRGARLFDARGALVVTQMALALVLLVGAALLARTIRNLDDVDIGYGARDALIASLELPDQSYDAAGRTRFAHELLDRIRVLPGVSAATLTTTLPPSPAGSRVSGMIPDSPAAPEDGVEIDITTVDDQYFATMDLPIIAGRSFTPADAHDAQGVVIVNDALARRFWPAGSAVGSRLYLDAERTEWWQIVGVAGDGKYRSLREATTFAMWRPVRQAGARYFTIVVRSPGNPFAMAEPLRAQLRALDPGVPLHSLSTLEQHIAQATAEERIAAQVATGFSLAALLLAAIGVYGVLAYFVVQHRREVGIRIALGAKRADVLRLVLGRGVGFVLLGIACGVPAAWAGSRILRSLVFGLSPTDAASYIVAAATLAAVALIAALLPARRAAAVQPGIVLRE
jgi:predicted permease